KDAAELIDAEFKNLPVLANLDAALTDDAPALWNENPDNEAFTFKRGDPVATEAAFASATHIVHHRVCVNRVAGNALENRGCIGYYDDKDDRYTLRATVQSVHGMRQQIADQIFKIPQSKLQVVCDNMGGGFGIRGGVYPEYALSLWASEVTERPVKWVADRTESILSDDHARGGYVDAELALDNDGRFLGLRTHTKVPIGAYYTTDRNVACATSGLGGLAGVYGIPAVYAQVTGVLTNMMSNSQYRGGAKPEPVHVLEVMVDVAARQLGINPVELRRRNTLTPDMLPLKTSMGDHFDCGEFTGNYENCLAAADYGNIAVRRASASARGKLLGFGTSNSITGVANSNFEHVEIRFDASGGVTLLSGAMDHGQGHGTTFKQVLSDRLGVDPSRVTYRYGDTDKIAHGVGTFNARVAVFVSAAIVEASDKIVEKGKRIAAHLLEAAQDDIEFAKGAFIVAGTDRSISLHDVAKAAFTRVKLPPGMEPGLYEHGQFGASPGTESTFPNGAHAAEIEIDKDTGKIELVRYTAIDDAGTILNPLLFDGQIHGGIVQGASQILMEDITYDCDTGQLVNASFMDYCMPRADDFCDFNIAANEVPTARNPLGVKGVGEAGTVGAMPAVMNAINDALSSAGASIIEMPATSEKVWRALEETLA
ncbi:MAG: molybdopterin cofactor-binding domain-containing protein, partial [Pseudomonadota bacterium]|nr:molybdopterin cofactor-binding domain-containing protein [Pseudomonadota bacterium]